MRIALVLKQEENEAKSHISNVVVFRVEQGKVVGVENTSITMNDIESLTKWAVTEEVKEIFIPETDDEIVPYFSKQGISMKSYDELGDNKLFQTFIV